MKLIADSGSTKTDWELLSGSGEVRNLQTSGINPFFRTGEDIFQELNKVLFPEARTRVNEIFFYGAGIVNAEKGQIIQQALKRIFPEAVVETHSDMLGAARALLGRHSGIACILGTGSNVGFYDGDQITRGISPLGYILGDEGSGAVMGRKLLGDYFKNVMPVYLQEAFEAKFHPQRDEILSRVYRGEKPNQYMAQFVLFLSEHSGSAYCQEFIQQNFTEFFERNVIKIPEFSKFPIGFSGSIAYYFGQILANVASYYGFENIRIIKNPIEGLRNFHDIKN